MVLLDTPSPWVTVYHGTTRGDGQAFLKHGVDTSILPQDRQHTGLEGRQGLFVSLRREDAINYGDQLLTLTVPRSSLHGTDRYGEPTYLMVSDKAIKQMIRDRVLQPYMDPDYWDPEWTSRADRTEDLRGLLVDSLQRDLRGVVTAWLGPCPWGLDPLAALSLVYKAPTSPSFSGGGNFPESMALFKGRLEPSQIELVPRPQPEQPLSPL